MKNIKQIVPFIINSIISQEIPEEFKDQVDELLKGANPGRKLVILSSLPDNVKNILKSFGVDSPSDAVPVTVELGHMLFNLFDSNSTYDESPLNQRLKTKHLQDLAECVSKDELEIPGFARDTIRTGLSDQKAWKNTAFTAYVQLGDEKRFFTMSHVGVNYFKEVINTALEEFCDV